jgi:hypothetical protein
MWCFLPHFVWLQYTGSEVVVVHKFGSYMVCLALLGLHTLLRLAPFRTPGAACGVVILPSMSQLVQHHHCGVQGTHMVSWC